MEDDDIPAAKRLAACGSLAEPCRYLRMEEAEFEETVIGMLGGLTFAVALLVLVLAVGGMTRRAV